MAPRVQLSVMGARMNFIYAMTLTLILAAPSFAAARTGTNLEIPRPLRKIFGTHKAMVNQTIRLTAANNRNQVSNARMLEVWRDELIPANRALLVKLQAVQPKTATSEKMIQVLEAFHSHLVAEKLVFETPNLVNRTTLKTSVELYYQRMQEFAVQTKSTQPRRSVASGK